MSTVYDDSMTRADLGVGPGGPGTPFCPGIFFL